MVGTTILHFMKNRIETERLSLVCCDKEILQALVDEDSAIAELLQVNVPAKWTEFGAPAFKYALERISADDEEETWWSYLPVFKDENMLIGSGGYKGKPTKDGMIEIGYEVAEGYRGRGFATEIARALIANGLRDERVKTIQAHTLPEENASGKVLKNCGMKWVEEIIDPEDGKLWRWEIKVRE